MNLVKTADMEQIYVIIKRHKWDWIEDESSVARQAMQCNPLDEEREALRDVEANCGKGVQESKQATGPVKSSVDSWRC